MLEIIIQERIKKRNNLEKAGYNLYPAKAVNKEEIKKVVDNFFFLYLLRKKVSVAGRIMGFRNQGGVFFIDIKDATGNIQGVANKKNLKDFAIFRDNLDIGDFVSLKGVVFKTKKGEKSVNIEKLEILTKSIIPLPSEWYGLSDTETRLRKRYLDFFVARALLCWYKARARVSMIGIFRGRPVGAAEVFRLNVAVMRVMIRLRLS